MCGGDHPSTPLPHVWGRQGLPQIPLSSPSTALSPLNPTRSESSPLSPKSISHLSHSLTLASFNDRAWGYPPPPTLKGEPSQNPGEEAASRRLQNLENLEKGTCPPRYASLLSGQLLFRARDWEVGGGGDGREGSDARAWCEHSPSRTHTPGAQRDKQQRREGQKGNPSGWGQRQKRTASFARFGDDASGLTSGPGLRPTEFISWSEASPACCAPNHRARSGERPWCGQAAMEGKPQVAFPTPLDLPRGTAGPRP